MGEALITRRGSDGGSPLTSLISGEYTMTTTYAASTGTTLQYANFPIPYDGCTETVLSFALESSYLIYRGTYYINWIDKTVTALDGELYSFSFGSDGKTVTIRIKSGTVTASVNRAASYIYKKE